MAFPVAARYIRFWCNSTYGPREQCGLHKVRFYEGGTAVNPPITADIWPADALVVNVKNAPYFAVGDGITDDYAALQAAISDYEGSLRMIYLPAGAYRVSQPLACRNNNVPVGTQRNGFTWIRGASRDTTTIRLDDGVLTNLSQPRHLLYTGFANTLNNFGGPGGIQQISRNLTEHLASPALGLFPNEGASLRLPVGDTPPLKIEPPANWVNARNYRITTEMDNAPAIQRAIDTGAATVYLPKGAYSISSPIFLRGALRHFAMLGSAFYRDSGLAALVLKDGATETVTIDNASETFTGNIPITISADRSLSCRNLGGFSWTSQTHRGRLYLENCVGDSIRIGVGSKLWGRGLNLENNNATFVSEMLTNNGGKLWVFGYKTEGRDTTVTTTRGGETELLGGLNYSGFSNAGTPMVRVEDSRVALVFAEVNFTGLPFNPIVVETSENVTRSFLSSQVPRAVGGARLQLYCSKRPLVEARISQPLGAQTQLTWNSIPTRKYFVETNTDLISPWQILPSSPATAATGQYRMNNTAPASDPRRFYRVALSDEP